MSSEIEAKYSVVGFDAIKRRLRTVGAEYLGTYLQRDEYFDTADRRLLDSGSGLRIRNRKKLAGPAGKEDLRPEITFKGPPSYQKRLKVRREQQSRLDNAEALVAVLDAVGLIQTMVIEKRRASYCVGRCLVELDELPVIGCFVEVEGACEREIHDVVELLELGGSPIEDHYVHLAIEGCKAMGTQWQEVTFERFGRGSAGL